MRLTCNIPYSIFICILSMTLLLASCDRKSTTGMVVKDSKTSADDTINPYVEGNKNIMRRQNEEIQMFLNRYGWQMDRTGTGLYIKITNPGHGDTFKENDRVTLEYSTFLLSGEKIYDSETLGMKTFLVNRSEEIDALHEAAQLLRPDAEATLIIPSYLAYGVAGDGDRIDGLQPIIMKIKVVNNEQNNTLPHIANIN